ncbi:hypothetical protein HPB48_016820 [Haemaphysalis longicornis]|uniref:Uncharacterized protein n=1 Tax=Haemaphysalis longicornis TaxID=44386 RepID=A0A9J6GL43_HAELO|nr:hypothetical protein HPB48_016820 [Haemaphysalis longicornis]
MVTNQLPATQATPTKVDNVEGQQNEATPHRNSLQSSSTPSNTVSEKEREGPATPHAVHKKEEAKRLRAASSQPSTTPGDDEGQPPAQATPASGSAASRLNAQAPSSPEPGLGEESQTLTPHQSNTLASQATGDSTPCQSDRSATPPTAVLAGMPQHGRESADRRRRRRGGG